MVARYTVFGVVALAAIAALGSWLVRTRKISPFSGLGRGLRAVTDPVITPVERRLVRMGGNPVHAGGWLVVITAVVGIVLLSLLGWVLSTFAMAQGAAAAGPRQTFALIVQMLYRILVFALLIRVLASWFGAFRYSRWIRPAYILTDWIVEPLRRIIPPMGAMDLSPLAAWFVLYLLRGFLMRVVLGA
jgi:YggT family protein